MKRSLALLVSIVILTLFGCRGSTAKYSPDPTVVTTVMPVWVDKNFTKSEHDQIIKGLNDWQYTLNGYLRFIIVSDTYDAEKEGTTVSDKVIKNLEGLIIRSTHVGDVEEIAVDPEQEGVLAWYTPEDFTIFMVEDRLEWRLFSTVFKHEVGHSLGAPHIKLLGSLMYPYYSNQGSCVDMASAILVASAHRYENWDIKNMRYCAASLQGN